MYEEYIEQNKKEISAIIQEMSDDFKEHKQDYFFRERISQEGDVAVDKAKKGSAPRYGVKVTQDCENFIYGYIRVLKGIIYKKNPDDDDRDSEAIAKDIMCTYILKEVYKNIDMPYNSRYQELINRRERYTKIKVIGILGFIICIIIVIICAIVTGGNAA